MALQPRIIACGNKLALYGMVARFIAGPAVMAIASIAVGLKGTTLKLSIVQAALPQGIVPFVFSWEYNLHPDVLSTAWVTPQNTKCSLSIYIYRKYIHDCNLNRTNICVCMCRVIFGMIVSLPITIVYYILLGIWGSHIWKDENINMNSAALFREIQDYGQNQQQQNSYVFVLSWGSVLLRHEAALGSDSFY